MTSLIMTSDLQNHGNVENTKNSISQEQNMIVYEIKKVFNLRLR